MPGQIQLDLFLVLYLYDSVFSEISSVHCKVDQNQSYYLWLFLLYIAPLRRRISQINPSETPL